MSPQELALVQEILASWLPHCEVRMFGSRARGNPKPYSDLDLVIMGETPTPLATLGQLQEAFASSDLPWRVDVVDWASTSPEFQQHIQTSSRPWPRS
jgi:predicted nucleotidyltransferase